MSISTIQNELNTIDRDIASAEKKKAEADKKAAELEARILSVQKTITKHMTTANMTPADIAAEMKRLLEKSEREV